ncbi:glycosyltransferase [Tunicatimonas pelagia]|uniref:glycosyltransferase n=1 Tax=Tunicatimonas pelagia TaxID=931531 RepID=UPI002665E3D5|nr:glycosyltransferase family 2 protein [Tunicatimonas pelagia]WKN40719.1 glycosyltransferase family 2 protein [Tunicatimonas pelagia]
MKDITVIICTYNRADILGDCLQSLVEQTCEPSHFEVLIVDNNSTDGTSQVAEHYTNQYPHFRWVREELQGLSHARNRGYNEATTPWVSYVDDDAKAHSNYVERALWTTRNFDFDCFGGTYYAWYKYGKPAWLPKNYGTKALDRRTVGITKDGYASGGVIIFKKSVLETLGGFPTHLGMKGNKISYGEETYLQVQMRKQGYTIGFDPELKIDHLVAKYKLKLWWHIQSQFRQGVISWETFDYSLENKKLTHMAKKAFFTLRDGIKLHTSQLLRPNYNWQHWIMDVVNPFAKDLGRLWGAYKLKRKH